MSTTTLILSYTDARVLVREVTRNVEGFHEELAFLESHTPDEKGIRHAVEGAALRGLRMGLQRAGLSPHSLINLEQAMRDEHGSIV